MVFLKSGSFCISQNIICCPYLKTGRQINEEVDRKPYLCRMMVILTLPRQSRKGPHDLMSNAEIEAIHFSAKPTSRWSKQLKMGLNVVTIIKENE